MLIPEMAPYIYGERTTRDAVAPYRIDLELYNEVAQAVANDEGATIAIQNYEKPASFYKATPDIERLVPKPAREEIFFALKNGFASTEVPARAIFLLNKAYAKTKIPNLIFKALSDDDFKVMFQANYLDGVCMRDVICSYICPDYSPITPGSYLSKHSEYTEIYIEETDMIAAVPNDIAVNMSVADIKSLRVTKKGIYLGDIPLRTLGGRYGATNSIYDLRECL